MSTAMLSRATEMCDDSMHPEWHLAALVTRGGSMLSSGRAKLQNAPEVLGELSGGKAMYGYGLTIHAEVDALSRCDAAGATLYVARKTPGHGKVAMARPCDNCMPMIVAAGVKKIIYTINPQQYGVIRVSKMLYDDPRAEIVYDQRGI